MSSGHASEQLGRFDRHDALHDPRYGEQHGHHVVPPTTHTVELAQVHELNEHLAGGPVHLLPEALRHGGGDAERPIGRIEYEGSPAFPWVYGVLADSGERVMLHTADLHTISRALNLRHHWGL